MTDPFAEQRARQDLQERIRRASEIRTAARLRATRKARRRGTAL